jgi:endonuclease/exonuclease/phosphatase family metal-dependent hydrolase
MHDFCNDVVPMSALLAPPVRRCARGAVVAVAVALAGCAGAGADSGAGPPPRRPARGATAAPSAALDSADIVLDGDVSDWPPDGAVVADGAHLYFRVKVAGASETIQAMRRPLLARFDLDGDGATGARYVTPESASDFGVDLEIVFSPRDEQAERGVGVAVSAVREDGRLLPIASHAIDLRFAPSYASEWYEGRLSLAGLRDAGLPRPAEGGAGKQVFVLGDGVGGVAGWAPPSAFHWPDVVQRPVRAEVEPSAKAPGDIRIMTWNVARGAPQQDPAPFARVIRSMAPDILLLQEWDDAGPAQIRDWLVAHVAADDAWSVVRSAGRGVAIVARSEIEPLAPARIQPAEMEYPVRFAGAIVATDAGPIAVGSAHLRCCGYAGSDEDRIRMIEATAINGTVAAALKQTQVAAVVIGGDLNLVGTRPPLDALADGLDLDGSPLQIAEPFALGDPVQATWSSAGSVFAPSRLDYILYSAAGAQVSQSFILDTRLLGESALESLRLHPDDTHASDHRPVFIDLRLAP